MLARLGRFLLVFAVLLAQQTALAHQYWHATPKAMAEKNLPAKGEGQIANEPDGMCLDADGNLYVAHYGMGQVQVLGRDGRLRHRYPAGNLTTSNVAFGGPRMDQLFITGALGDEKTTPGALFRLDLGIRGLSTIPR